MQVTNSYISIYPKAVPVYHCKHKMLLPLGCDTVSFSGKAKEVKSHEQACVTEKESYLHLYKLCQKRYHSFFENAGPKDASVYLDYFFNRYEDNIRSMSELCDKELNSILLDRGIGNFMNYIKIIHSFKKNKTFELLKSALTCTNPDGSKLRQNQKVQLVDLLNAYKTLHILPNELKQMAAEGKIDIPALQKSVLRVVLLYVGHYSNEELEEISKSKFNSWDKEYAYLLSTSAAKSDVFEDVVRMANRCGNFKTHIHSKNNEYGRNNAKTRRMFENLGLDYDKWVSPSEKNNVHLKINGNNIDTLGEIAEGISDTVDILRCVPAVRKIIDKNYKSFITSDKFEFPNDMLSSKSELLKFLIKFDNDMLPVWKRAEKNVNSEKDKKEIKPSAKVTVKMKEHISEYVKILQNYDQNQNLDLTIKMWDRVPQKDLFQGNYSTCCIAMGKANAEFMPAYLLNTAFNMVEIVDNKSGKTVGNSVCYYLKNSDNKPIFVFDNVEINNTFKNNLSNDMSKKLREGLACYAKNLNREVCAKDIPVYVGTTNNDIFLEDLQSHLLNPTLIGALNPTEEVYLDVFEGNVLPDKIGGCISLYPLSE